jgi:hypothetical protein
MTYFHDETNSGGTFSLHELVRVFLDCEPEQVKKEIIKEVEVINKNLNLEDWVMDQEVLKLCAKYGKNKIKRIVKYFYVELKQ